MVQATIKCVWKVEISGNVAKKMMIHQDNKNPIYYFVSLKSFLNHKEYLDTVEYWIEFNIKKMKILDSTH